MLNWKLLDSVHKDLDYQTLMAPAWCHCYPSASCTGLLPSSFPHMQVTVLSYRFLAAVCGASRGWSWFESQGHTCWESWRTLLDFIALYVLSEMSRRYKFSKVKHQKPFDCFFPNADHLLQHLSCCDNARWLGRMDTGNALTQSEVIL